jgi:hypothetical protein
MGAFARCLPFFSHNFTNPLFFFPYQFLRANFLSLCTDFEPILGVRVKEDLAKSLVRILHVERKASEALAELAMAEVLGQENGRIFLIKCLNNRLNSL